MDMDMTKRCSKCNEIKSLDLFSKAKKHPDGYKYHCKACGSSMTIEWQKNNKDKRRAKDAKYRDSNKEIQKRRVELCFLKNKDKYLNKKQEYRLKNKESLRNKSRDRYFRLKDRISEVNKLWSKNNRGKRNAALVKYRAQKLNATPSWLTSEHLKEIEMFYKVAAWLNGWKIMQFHVDHIIPLQGKEVSGLHVPWNLQILTAEENLKKNNKLNITE